MVCRVVIYAAAATKGTRCMRAIAVQKLIVIVVLAVGAGAEGFFFVKVVVGV